MTLPRHLSPRRTRRVLGVRVTEHTMINFWGLVGMLIILALCLYG